MAWFKVDDKFHSSEEVMSIPLSERAAAIGLWTLAGAWSADQLKDGFVPRTHVEMWGGTDASAAALVRAKLWTRVGTKGFQFRNWEKWQVTRSDIESERISWREKKAAQRAARAEKTAERPDLVPGDNPGSPPPVPSLPSLPDPTLSKGTEVRTPRKRGTRVPSNFAITDDMRAWAKEEVPMVDLDAKLPEWIDYWTSAPNGIKTDWVATWRNGMRKQQEFAERDRPKTSKKIAPKDEWKYR